MRAPPRPIEQSLVTIPLLILAAIAAIYVIMGVLYESFVHPITILSSLPAAGVGALAILMLFGYELTLIAIIGIILLMGIVKKNAIMMIDFAIEAERTEGKSPSGCDPPGLSAALPPDLDDDRLRAGRRPAAGARIGAGSELRRPLGVAIVGGLLVSQWLTLYTTPIVYLYLDALAQRLGRRRCGRERPFRPTGALIGGGRLPPAPGADAIAPTAHPTDETRGGIR